MDPDQTGDPEKLAENEKFKGNESLKAGDLEEAVVYYTRSIGYSPMAAVYTNRSLANLKLKRFEKAEQDASFALKLIDSLTPQLELKAYLRRGTAFMKRGLYKLAIKDFEKGNQIHREKLSAGESSEARKLRDECLLKLKDLDPKAPKKTRYKIEEVDEEEIDLVINPAQPGRAPLIQELPDEDNQSGPKPLRNNEDSFGASFVKTEQKEESSPEPILMEISSKRTTKTTVIAEETTDSQDSPKEQMNGKSTSSSSKRSVLTQQTSDDITVSKSTIEDVQDFENDYSDEENEPLVEQLATQDYSDFEDSSEEDEKEEEASEEEEEEEVPDEEAIVLHRKATNLAEFEETWRRVKKSGQIGGEEWVTFLLGNNARELASFISPESDPSMIQDVASGLKAVVLEYPQYIRDVLRYVVDTGALKVILEKAPAACALALKDLLLSLAKEFPNENHT